MATITLPPLRTAKATLTPGSPTTQTLTTLKAGDIIRGLSIEVSEAFNGPATVQIGSVGFPALIVDSSDSDLERIDKYQCNASFFLSSDETILISFSNGGSSMGSATVLLVFDKGI